MWLSLLFCLLGTSASMRSHQAAERNAKAATETITTAFTVSGTQARWLVLDCGSHEYNWKTIITKMMLGVTYASVDEGPDLVVKDIVSVQEKNIAGQRESGSWTVEVTWTPTAAAQRGCRAKHEQLVQRQDPECLTDWVVKNVPRDWYNVETGGRVYMTSNSEFTITAIGFTDVTTKLTVSGTKAREVVFNSGSHEFNLKAIITRIIEGENYEVSNNFPVVLKKEHEIQNTNDQPLWLVYLTWTASPIIQKKYFTEIPNMEIQNELDTLSKWVIQNVPYEWWNAETRGRLYMKGDSEFKIEWVE